jgi:glutamine phosphoribosylpyrophosphate amidotransferase
MVEPSISGIWNPTEKTLKSFQALHDALAKDDTLLELEICTLQNGQIQSLYAFDALTLLSDWQKQKQPLGGLSITFLRPTPIYTVYLPEESGAIPIHSNGRFAVTCLGVIDNLPEIQKELLSYGYEFGTKNVAETLSHLFSHYLEFDQIPPVEAMHVVMNCLDGHFAFMVLIAKEECLMVGSRDYPLAIGKDDPTVYFGTDTETLALFAPSITDVSRESIPAMFCATSFKS